MINLTREEAQQVLDALINAKGYIFYNVLDDKGNRYDAAANILRAKLSEYPDNFIDALKFHTAMQELEPEPVAWIFQHEDTGQTDCVDNQQVEWGFEKNNPRWQKIAPLYTVPPQLEPEPIGYMDATMLKNWDALKGTEFECTERSYFPFSRTPFKIDNIDCCIPIYSRPPQRDYDTKEEAAAAYTAVKIFCEKKEWQGLTDEEVGMLTVFDGLHHVEIPLLAKFARAIEAKLKEKNHG